MCSKLRFNYIPLVCGCLFGAYPCFILLLLFLSIITFTSSLFFSLLSLDYYNIYLLCVCPLLLAPASWLLSRRYFLFSTSFCMCPDFPLSVVPRPFTLVCFYRSYFSPCGRPLSSNGLCLCVAYPRFPFFVILYFAPYFAYCSLLRWFSPVYYAVLLFAFLVSFLTWQFTFCKSPSPYSW